VIAKAPVAANAVTNPRNRAIVNATSLWKARLKEVDVGQELSKQGSKLI
jgi:hypothetical protein